VPQADVHVVQVSFQDYEEEIRRIRNTVFSREQGIDGRGLGIGSRLVEGLMRIAAERGLGNVYLNSQINAVGFYRALNFEAVGDPFMEADIEHLRMERQLDPS
jgi:predicted GNAT family N-acyltransferase